MGRNTNREFTGCDILSPLKELCPQSLGRSLRRGYRVNEEMRVLLLHLVFAFPGAAWSFAAPRSSRCHVGSHFPAMILLFSLAVAFLLPILATCVLFLAC
ncbi:hypothetical protein Tco_1371224 [Tanacetum coccineum]